MKSVLTGTRSLPGLLGTHCYMLFVAMSALSTDLLEAQAGIRVGVPIRSVSPAFIRLTSARELADGTLLLPDAGDRQLFAVPPGSDEPRALLRQGDGPGELRAAGWIVATQSDSSILSDAYNGRRLVLAGTRVVSTVAPPTPEARTEPDLLGFATRRGILVIRSAGALRTVSDSLDVIVESPNRASSRVVARLKGKGGEGRRIRPPSGGRPGEIITAGPYATEEQAALSSDGWVAVARLNPYRLDWQRPDGTWLLGAPIPDAPIRISPEERCFAFRRMTLSDYPCNDIPADGWPNAVPPFLAASSAHPALPLRIDPFGRAVVARTPTASRQRMTYDVIDRRGNRVGVLQLGVDEVILGFGNASVIIGFSNADGLQGVRVHAWPDVIR